MPQKLILDIDPGFEDALVLSLALFSPEVDLLGLTSVGGKTDAQTSFRNLRSLIEFFDPPHIPRIGFGSEPDEGFPADAREFYGEDGLGGLSRPTVDRRSSTPAEKVICDIVRSNPMEVSILCLGPLTNIARAMRRDPEFSQLIKRLYICGGTWDCPGNITPAAEYNIFCDPKSAQYVFRAPGSKTMIPLDVSREMTCSIQIINDLPAKNSRYGEFLNKLFVAMFRSQRQVYGLETIRLYEVLAWYAVFMPNLFETKYESCEVESMGLITSGQTVFDRRFNARWRRNVEVFCELLNPDKVRSQLLTDFERVDRILAR